MAIVGQNPTNESLNQCPKCTRLFKKGTYHLRNCFVELHRTKNPVSPLKQKTHEDTLSKLTKPQNKRKRKLFLKKPKSPEGPNSWRVRHTTSPKNSESLNWRASTPSPVSTSSDSSILNISDTDKETPNHGAQIQGQYILKPLDVIKISQNDQNTRLQIKTYKELFPIYIAPGKKRNIKNLRKELLKAAQFFNIFNFTYLSVRDSFPYKFTDFHALHEEINSRPNAWKYFYKK